MSISYYISGRFGNNLFQYFATKVLGKILNKEYIFNDSKKPLTRDSNNEKIKVDNMVEIDEEKFNDIISKNEYLIEGNIYVIGFFQTQDWITLYKDYIQSLFTEENTDRINNEYTISGIFKIVNKINPVRDDILIVHLRLDDFLHNIRNSEVIHPDSIIETIKGIDGINKVIFISDKIKRSWEMSYIKYLMNNVKNSTSVTNSLITDFGIMYKAKKIMFCRSTLGWIAGILSKENTSNWFPINKEFKHQTVNKINENTIVFEPAYLKSLNIFGEQDIYNMY
jgi:hypothetical protein